MQPIDQNDKDLLELARENGGGIQVTQDNQARIQRLVSRGLLEKFGNRYHLTEAAKAAISE